MGSICGEVVFMFVSDEGCCLCYEFGDMGLLLLMVVLMRENLK